jgi:hypothetical protein
MVRTSIILGVVSLLLLGFILFFEKGSLSTGEREARQGRVLTSFVRERVLALEIQAKGVTTRISRGPDPENDLELGAWKVEAPFKAAADQDAVEVLVGELEWLEARRTLDELSAKDLARFGLDKPRYRVRFETGKQRDVLSVGANAPTGEGTYVQLAAEPTRAYVVGKDLIEAIDQEPGHYHTKELHDGLTIYGSERLVLRDAEGERVLVKQKGQWQLAAPEQGLAALPALEGVFTTLDALRAARFVAAQPGKLGDYGLDKPVFEAELTRKRYDDKLKKTTDELETTTFRVGKACAGHAKESYLRMDDGGPVVCVLDDDWQKARLPLEALREKRLLPLDDTQVERIEVQQGARKLTLSEKEEVWSFALVEGKQTLAEGKAHTTQVQSWLKWLRSSEVQAFTPQDQVSAGAARLGRVLYNLRVDRSGEYPDYVLQIGEPELDGVPAQRNDEPALIRFGAEIVPLLEPIAARFRDPTLLAEAEGKLSRLTIERASGLTESAERTPEGWRFTSAGSTQAPNAVTLGELARLLSGLQAQRFVADAPAAVHGLAQPALQVRFAYASAAPAAAKQALEHSLRIGAETSDGRYAQLDAKPAVFVLAPDLLRLLSASLASQPIELAPVDAGPLRDLAEPTEPGEPAEPTEPSEAPAP